MFDELAGVVGVNPERLTFRQLVRMAEGKEKSAWWHTAHQIAALVNVNRGRNAPPASAQSFHPYYARAKAGQQRLTKKTFGGLWAACGGK